MDTDFEESLISEEEESIKLKRRLVALQTVRTDFQRKDTIIANLKARIIALEKENRDIFVLNSKISFLENALSDQHALLNEIQFLNAELKRCQFIMNCFCKF
jgi:hypothetical protein